MGTAMKNLYTEEYLKKVLLENAAKLGRTPKKRETKHATAIAKRLGNGSWNKALESVGLVPYEQKTYMKEDLSAILKDWYAKNNRYPSVKIFNDDPNLPNPTTYETKFEKHWSEIVKEVLNIEPLKSKKGIYDGLSETELLDIFKKEYERIQPRSKNEFEQKRSKNTPSVHFYMRRFNTWNELKILAGIADIKNIRREKDEWIKLLRKITKLLGHPPTTKDLEKLNIDVVSFYPHLGSLNEALKAAGINPMNSTPEKVQETKEELFKMYLNFCRKIGKLASIPDLDSSNEIYNADVFIIRFGTMGDLKKEALKILKFDENIYSKRKYTREEILEKLIKIWNEHGKLPAKQLSEIEDLPSISSILRHMNCTSLDDVWEEVKSHDDSFKK
ncbi:hypothetical protein J9303_00840 [Bacillaceae bacterium Marseille-Q3522]|nr:hypothetical protein [Bacillaceae bacterium Marseille-Q3522]